MLKSFMTRLNNLPRDSRDTLFQLAVIGWTIGTRFDRQVVALCLRSLPMVLASILALIVLALTRYAVVGLRTSDVTTARTERGAVTGASDGAGVVRIAHHLVPLS